MKTIAAIIFENDKGEFLFFLRDNKPGIPFPLHWDLFGGHVEEGETPEEALVREVKEEITLLEGKYARYFTREEIPGIEFANILKDIILDYNDNRQNQG
jgi:8-oxo-dGTP pyrophosphatase MutT (NUDIX family)